MDHVALKLEFETDKFLLTGPLPEDINAGNQFYGEDFAKWICETLSAWNLSCGDEDWGWDVFSTRGKTPEVINNQVCVYAYPADLQSGNYGQWMLIVHSEEKVPWLRFFTRWKYIHFDRQLGIELLNAVRGIGVQNLRATVIYLDSAGNERKEEPFSA